MEHPAILPTETAVSTMTKPRRSLAAFLLFAFLGGLALARVALLDGAIGGLGSVLGDSAFQRWLLDAALISLGVTAVTVACALITASLMAGTRPRRVSTSTLAVQLFAGATLLVVLCVALSALGAVNGVVASAVVATLMSLPLAVWQLAAAYRTVPRNLYDMARIDGCSPMQRFRAVTFPAIARPLLVAALFALMMAWGVTGIGCLVFSKLGETNANVVVAPELVAAAVLLMSIPLLVCFLGITAAAAARRPIAPPD